jgi:hypothetical protein
MIHSRQQHHKSFLITGAISLPAMMRSIVNSWNATLHLKRWQKLIANYNPR